MEIKWDNVWKTLNIVPETWEGLNKGSHSIFKFMISYKGKTKWTCFCSLIKNLEHLLRFTSLGVLGRVMSNSWFLLLRNSYGAGRKPICKWIMKIQEEKLPPSAVNSKLWGMEGKGTQIRWLGFALPTPFYEVYTPEETVCQVPNTLLLFHVTVVLSAWNVASPYLSS